MAYDKKIVIKIGSSLLVEKDNTHYYQIFAQQIQHCLEHNYFPVIVSSGAVANGMQRTSTTQRPLSISHLRALAAIGQTELMIRWRKALEKHNLTTAQVLINHNDLQNRDSYLNIRSTLQQLTEMHIIPIINENDSVADEELRFGDNDQLAGAVASLIEADKLVLLTNVDGILDQNNHIIHQSSISNPQLIAVAKGSSHLGRGGMITKLKAANIASMAGITTHILNGNNDTALKQILKGEVIGSTLLPELNQPTFKARKRWIEQKKSKGELSIDDGAVAALNRGASLLAVGVRDCVGEFKRGQAVTIMNQAGDKIAKGIVNLDYTLLKQCMGLASDECSKILKQPIEDEVINRDNLVLYS